MKKKTLAMLLSAIMVITTAAFGTIAYLTDTAEVTNKFTVGNVSIKVEETDVNENGKPVDSEGNEIDPENPDQQPVRKEEGNTYHLLPGLTYTKDPTLTVEAGSEEAYVRMIVTITHIDKVRSALGQDFLPQNHVTGWDPAVWPCVSVKDVTETVKDPVTQQDVTLQSAVYEFRYPSTVSGLGDDTTPAADQELEPLFTAFTVPAELTGAQLAELAQMEIRVEGYAIQASGFATADEAWAGFDQQMTPKAASEKAPVPDPVPDTTL